MPSNVDNTSPNIHAMFGTNEISPATQQQMAGGIDIGALINANSSQPSEEAGNADWVSLLA